MKNLNTYINEAWSGVKKHTNNAEIEAWCKEMGIERYTINDKGEIDVDGSVDLHYKDFKELPYKFGIVDRIFSLSGNKNLTSLKNCPNYVGNMFGCSLCSQLDSLEGCPKEVGGDFWCNDCKRKFAKEEIKSLCKVKGVVTHTLQTLPKINF